ncbi:MAG: AAA family ATPase, partial [bacterium]|nr:AAA family ATPase [bacterium]
PDKGGVDISDYIRWCVEAEGADPDTLKERICIAVEHMPAWKEPNAAKPEEYFIVKSGNDWLTDSRQQKAPKQLFGELWYENEVAILFADTNVGKSILAVQIADAISRGKSGDESGRLLTKVDEQKVVYFDFELTAKQFEARLSEADAETGEYKNHYRFHPNFYRAEINPDTTDFGRFRTFEDFVNHAFETTIASTGAKVLIVDNITYLRNETENARNALPMMKFLKSLKSRYDLSLLVLAHTPKRDAGKPIGRNDLQGSKMIINFCDSAFAIGESSKQTGTRYIKQIKARNTEIVYNADNVLLANIRKQSNFLEFVFGETAFEREHLRVITDDQREGLQIKVMELRDQGLTLRAIGEQLKISAMTASRYLRNVPEDDRSADTPVNSDTKDGDLGLDP